MKKEQLLIQEECDKKGYFLFNKVGEGRIYPDVEVYLDKLPHAIYVSTVIFLELTNDESNIMGGTTYSLLPKKLCRERYSLFIKRKIEAKYRFVGEIHRHELQSYFKEFERSVIREVRHGRITGKEEDIYYRDEMTGQYKKVSTEFHERFEIIPSKNNKRNLVEMIMKLPKWFLKIYNKKSYDF